MKCIHVRCKGNLNNNNNIDNIIKMYFSIGERKAQGKINFCKDDAQET